MRKALNIFRILIACVLVLILAVNLYFLGAKYIAHERYPKLLGFSTSAVLSGSMEPVFSAGDFLIYREKDSYAVGDIVIFSEGSNYITHRIVEETPEGFITQGDANNAPDPTVLNPANIEGCMVLFIPKLGSFILFLRSPIGTFSLILLGLLFWELPGILKLFHRKKGKYEN